MGTISSRDDKADLVIWCDFSGFFNEVDSWGCVDFLCCLAEIFVVFGWVLLGFLGNFIVNLQRDLCVVWLRFLLVFLMGFVGIFRKFHCEFTKGFMCCLAWIFACFSRIFVGIFRRFHWEFSKGFMCVVWLGFLLFFFGFLLVLKEIFIGGVVDAGDQVMGFIVAKVPLQIEF